MHLTARLREARTRILLVLLLPTMMIAGGPVGAFAQHDHGDHDHGSDAVVASCDALGTPAAMGEHEHQPASASTPAAASHRDHAEIEFDLLYIDMMLPHHDSMVALAEVALPHLTDPRLKEMARSIIRTQSAENEQLTQWRVKWFGSGEPDLGEASMTQMLEAMPVTDMDGMMREMDTAWQVETFCTAENPDLAFIEQVISHHQMAIDTSEIAITEATHPELVTFADGVIVAQQAELDQLNAILDEYETGATPAG